MMKTTPKKQKTCIAYLRAATAQGIAEQKKQLTTYAAANGLTITSWQEHRGRRDGIVSLYHYCRQNSPFVQLLLVTSADRLTRNAIAGITLIEKLRTELGIKLLTAQTPAIPAIADLLHPVSKVLSGSVKTVSAARAGTSNSVADAAKPGNRRKPVQHKKRPVFSIK
ncbi:MAG TPA: recombinase family protein [Chitinophagaceae bacterium]|jgi:hypothetical protein|nr:recombinase family protein [Chitinophagaceae bacterium]